MRFPYALRAMGKSAEKERNSNVILIHRCLREITESVDIEKEIRSTSAIIPTDERAIRESYIVQEEGRKDSAHQYARKQFLRRVIFYLRRIHVDESRRIYPPIDAHNPSEEMLNVSPATNNIGGPHNKQSR